MPLPILEIEQELVDAVGKSNRVILEAPTGSGKSTQAPRILLESGMFESGEIIVLQPRRMAARLLAKRVAWEMETRLGDVVGYRIRHENVSGPKTRIRFVTEGVLLRMLIADPELKGVAAILFDEFHERSLHADVTLARSLMAQSSNRSDLRIVVMSATLDTGALTRYLGDCAVVSSDGRMYPVALRYIDTKAARSGKPIWELAANATVAAVQDEGEGHVLIFMPGGYEIGRTIRALGERLSSAAFEILPLHSELSARDQDRAVEGSDRRKIIVSTNVAETSLTIDDVRVVIDSGQARIARYDPMRAINTLYIEKISDASARQRMGRAGRTAEGLCVRLWSERDHASRAEHDEPEVKRLDLAETILALKASGVEDLDTFNWFEVPEPSRLQDALGLLDKLGALEGTGRLSQRGREMSRMPLHPRYGAMLIKAGELGCVDEISLVSAIAQSRNMLLRKVDRSVEDRRSAAWGSAEGVSDIVGQMTLWAGANRQRFDMRYCREYGIHADTARQIGKAGQQIAAVAGKSSAPRSRDPSSWMRCLLIGFPDRVCRRLDRGTRRCDMMGGRRGSLARESLATDAELFVALEASEIGTQNGGATTVLSLCSAIEREWLVELVPDGFESGEETVFDEKKKRVVSRKFARFYDLELESVESLDVDLDRSASILASLVSEGKAKLDNWGADEESLIARANLIASTFPEYGVDRIDDDARKLLVEQCCHGARSLRDLKKQAARKAIESWIGVETLAAMDSYAPTRLELANGRVARIRYADGEIPTLSAKIQELYDVPAPISICQGRVNPRVELLAPNMRPVQLTEDLASFWEQSYPGIKKELKGRYPKHKWR